MTHSVKLLTAASAAAMLASATPALAQATTAGTDVNNTVTVNFNVGGNAQTAATGTDTFKVDRKVFFTVTTTDAAAVSVSPGQTGAVTTFNVKNDTNDVMDYALNVLQNTGGAGKFGGVDNFNVTVPVIWVESNGTPGLQTGPGGDTQIDYLDNLADGASRTVYVVSNIPTGQSTNDQATINLIATANAGSGTSASRTVLVASNGVDDKAVVDNVFADVAGSAAGDIARDGKHSSADDYKVLAAAITAKKYSRVISDPVNNTTNPKAIPGAIVEYCIAVQNAVGSATATGIQINDPIPAQTQTITNVFKNGTITPAAFTAGTFTCTGGTAGTTYAPAATSVSETLTDLAASEIKTVYFRVMVK